MIIKELLQSYESDYLPQIISQARTKSCLNKLGEYFGTKEVESIGYESIAEYRKIRNLHVSGSTVNRELSVLSSVYRWARKRGISSLNPPVERTRETPRSKALTEDQVKLIASKAKDAKTECYIWLLFLTGQRKSAVLQIKKSQIQSNYIDFKPTDALGHRRKRRATIPLSPKIRLILERLNAISGDSEYVFGKLYSRQLDDNLKEAAKSAGLDWVTAHIFRHSTATHLLEKGIAIEQVSAYLGHSAIGITQKVYIHQSSSYLNKASLAIGA